MFPVLPGAVDDDFFNLEVEGPDGPTVVLLNKLDFQKSARYGMPKQLECRVRSIDEKGVPVLGHAIGTYVNELYSQIYEKGESFECVVVSVPANPAEEPYNIRDKNGIFFRIYEGDGLLTKGQKIRCKIKSLSGKRFEIKRTDEHSKLPYISPKELFDGAGVQRATRRVFGYLLELPGSDNLRAEINSHKSQWPLTAATLIRDNLSEWFVRLQSRGLRLLTPVLLTDLKKSLLYLLEDSNFLNSLPAEQRRAYQQLLTEHVEGIDPYNTALRLLQQGSEDSFVKGLFDKLQKSGYLYHPAKQFGIMMLVFKIYPEKVSSYLNSIFESIFMRDLDNWKREPFRSAFVEQFQIYVRQARREIDALPIAEKREQKLRLETIITALALELLLAAKEDTDRTRSLFYRYVSLLRPLNSEALLSKSFVALLGGQLPERLEYSMLREPMMMMTHATVMPAGDIMSRLGDNFRYTNGMVDFNIGERGLSLTRSFDRRLRAEGCVERVIPDGFMSWLRPQVYVNGVKGLSASKMRSLADHKIWWKEIETALFDSPTVQEDEATARAAEVGDEVWIVVDGINDSNDNDPTFLCHIQDDFYLEGKGKLKRSQIVNYNLRQPDLQSFRSADGHPLGFQAKVIGVNRAGEYTFSLSEQIHEYTHSLLNFSDEYIGVVTGSSPQGYNTISRDGIGLFLRDDLHPDRELDPGTVVRFRVTTVPTHGYIIGYITDTPVTEADRFDKFEAFDNLMHSIGTLGEAEESESESFEDDSYEYLSPDSVREIIEIIRFNAIANSDLIKAYDYLRYARLLALTIGDQHLAEKLLAHSSLLGLHQYYATNTRIDSEELEKLRPLSTTDPLLAKLFHRLEIVSWLGKPEHNSALFATAQTPDTEIEGSLARMVLSYNMMEAMDNDEESFTTELKTRIMSKLNVNSETKTGTYYGSESKYVEFKTSLVYVAMAPGEPVKESPADQQAHILSRIAGMLNASGGTLYIGVNNDGYAVGMRDDFRYYERHKLRMGNHTFEIKNIDNLCVFLENLVNKTFGETIARKIEIGTDDKADKDVIVISIQESLTPVYVDGRLYVRQSGQSTREYNGQVKADFLAEREQQRIEKQHIAAMAAAEARQNQSAEQAEEAAAVAEEAKVIEAAAVDSEEAEVPEASSGLTTSMWRPNVLHSYDDDYNEPFGYIYFKGETGLQFSTSDIYMDLEEGTRLSLIIPHELKDGFLLLGFTNERVIKVPLSEIYERGEGTDMNHSADYPLMFAAIAGKDDLLLGMATDGSGTVWRRAFNVGQIEPGHISNIPKRLTDSSTAATVGWEIVDASVAENFASCSGEKVGGKRFGETMRIKADDRRWPERLREQAEKCKPAN